MLVKMGKQPLFKTAIIDVESTLTGFCSMEGRLGSVLNTGKGRNLEPRSRAELAHGKLVNGNIGGRVDSA